VLKLLCRGTTKDPIPHGPPRHLQHVTEEEFYVEWNGRIDNPWNAGVVAFVLEKLKHEYPGRFVPADDEFIMEMILLHLKYLRTRYHEQIHPSTAQELASKALHNAAMTRKATVNSVGVHLSLFITDQCSFLLLS